MLMPQLQSFSLIEQQQDDLSGIRSSSFYLSCVIGGGQGQMGSKAISSSGRLPTTYLQVVIIDHTPIR